jgi:hypothetical protein
MQCYTAVTVYISVMSRYALHARSASIALLSVFHALTAIGYDLNTPKHHTYLHLIHSEYSTIIIMSHV